MTKWSLFGVLCLTLILSAVWKECRFGKWKSSICWVVLLLSVFGFAVIQYGRETAFRETYMNQLTDGKNIKVCGQVYKKEYKKEVYCYYLKNCSIHLGKEVIPCNQILSYFNSDDYSIGDTLFINGKVKMFERATNEGQFDAYSFYQSQKLDFAICDGAVVKSKQGEVLLGEWLYQMRQKLVLVIKYHLEDAEAGVLASILYGDKSLMLDDIKNLYQDSGISHILAISGLHISLVGMMLYRLLRKNRCSFWASAIAAGVLIHLYGTMTGDAISTQRAIGMMMLSMGAQVLGRTNDLLNSLGMMVLVLLITNPFLLGYAGFTFSVVAVCGVGITGTIFSQEGWEKEANAQIQRKSLSRQIKRKDNRIQRAQKLKKGIWMSVGIWVTTLPLVAFHYYEIPMYGVALNLLIVPLLKIVFISGMFGSVIGLYTKELSAWCLQPAALILDLYSELCEFTANLPGANIIVGKPSVKRIMIYYLVLGGILGVICSLRFRSEVQRQRLEESNRSTVQNSDHNEDRNVTCEYQQRIERLILILKISICPLLVSILMIHGSNANEITILDVGQGDGIYVSAQDGTRLFIDGGSSSVKQVGEYRILPFLKSKGVSQVDYWFVSHTDDDHMNGLMEVMESGYEIRSLVVSEYIVRDEAYQKLISSAKHYEIPVLEMNKGDAITSKDIRMECIYPNREVFDDKNDMSLTLKLTMGECTGIFAGDISAEAERILVQEHLLDPLDIYKVNHHGSKNSSSEAFLEKIHPKVAVISCAKQNRYGHPADEAIKRIEAMKSSIFYTMHGGQISVKVRKKGVEVTEYLN